MRFRFRVWTILIGILLPVAALAQNSALDHFEKKVRPLLAGNCFMCHSTEAATPQGGLLLDSTAGIRRGGNSGALTNPQDPDRSLLLRALRYTDKNLKMPPGEALPAEALAEIETWVRNGAPLPESTAAAAHAPSSSSLWSLQPPRAAKPPEVANRGAVKNEIDRFILKRLEEKGLNLSPEADRRTLIRRAYYDMTGLPPSAEEIAAFVRDSSPRAYEALIDRLLASPHYGERWGRHWLDVARYADSAIDAVNAAQRYAWSYTYRDWVIQSLNQDLPYDQFLLYQLAADRVPNLAPRHRAALGFLSLGREVIDNIPETVDDKIDAVTRGLLGLTVSCARCHDHKYDPITTRDYYSLFGIFSNMREPAELPLLRAHWAPTAKDTLYLNRLDRILDDDRAYRTRRHAERLAFFKSQTSEYILAAHDAEKLTNPEVEELVRERQLNLHVLRRWRAYLRQSKKSGEPVFRLWHAACNKPDSPAGWTDTKAPATNPVVSADLKAHPATSLKELSARYAEILQRFDRPEPYAAPAEEQLRAVLRGAQSPLSIPIEDFKLIYSEGDSNNTRAIRGRFVAMRAMYAYAGGTPRAMAVEDVPAPQPAHVFIRGNPNNPGAATPPRFLSCLAGPEGAIFKDGNGRLDLARAIIDPENPLTARVMVNRVWLHHFGAGLVRTPSDFGVRGEPPTHPELLDTLAVKFKESGWSLKKLHRLIMLSAVYRQSSAENLAASKVDPENLLLWRMNRRRLDIEAVRDSMLAAAGTLDRQIGGVPFVLTALPPVPRRTLYGFIERGRLPGVLGSFDFPAPDQHAPMRVTTTVPQQSLFFLNSPFVMEQAAALARRSANPRSNDPSERVRQLYRFVFARAPESEELAAGLQFVEQAVKEPAAATPATEAWRYGTGQFDRAAGKVLAFIDFSTFVPDSWQGASLLPAPRSGKAALNAAGGEPGELVSQSVVRRWTSPTTTTISIEGTLKHTQGPVPAGDGIIGRIVCSRGGELASWSLSGTTAETKISGVKVEKGDTIDFLVEGRANIENDGFAWAPVVKSEETTWDAKKDFRGPSAQPLDAWARYAQVLLATNEFAFVD